MSKFKKTIKDICVDNKIDRREIELIIAHVLGKSREFLIAHPETNIGLLDYWKIRTLQKKRATGIPLAYLTGHKEFFGLDFDVNKHTLVPRPDTEIMIESAIKKIKNQKSTPWRKCSLKIKNHK